MSELYSKNICSKYVSGKELNYSIKYFMPRPCTVMKLVTYYDKGFMNGILKNPTKHGRNDTVLVHDVCYMSAQVSV